MSETTGENITNPEESKTMPTQKDLRTEEEIELEQKMVKVISAMPATAQDRFKVLNMLSDQRSKINDEFEAEVAALRAKISLKKETKFEERENVLNGIITKFEDYMVPYAERNTEVDEAVQKINSKKTEEEIAEFVEEAKLHIPTDVTHLINEKGVPAFWRQVVTEHYVLQTMYSDKDLEVLEHLTSFNVTWDRDSKPAEIFTVQLGFEGNDFFTNCMLRFTVKAIDDDCKEVIGCDIDWYDGKDVTKKKIQKTQKNKKTNQTRVVTRTVQTESIFNCFKSMKLKDDVKDKEESDENGEDVKLMDQLEEARLFAVNLYDIYSIEGFEHYLGHYDKYAIEEMKRAGECSGEDSDRDEYDGKKPPKKECCIK